jgi:hypothetical protein
MSSHSNLPLTVGYTEVDKTLLNTVRLHDSWSDSIVVSVAINPATENVPYPITITECRVEFDDDARTVLRAPGSGQPGDCSAWTEASLKILAKEMKILDIDRDSTKVISGITYPNITAAGSMVFSGQYTKVVFPCDRIGYLDDFKEEENVVTSHPYADELGTESLYVDKIPNEWDHLTEFRPDPTHDCTLTYHIHVIYQGGIYAGVGGVADDPNTPEDESVPSIPGITILDGYEIHTITQKVLNNHDDNIKIMRHLISKERGQDVMEEKYKYGTKHSDYEQYDTELGEKQYASSD